MLITLLRIDVNYLNVKLSSLDTKKFRIICSEKKARVRWMNEGDANTAYFHATIKYNRRKLNIRRIQDDHGNWLEGDH